MKIIYITLILIGLVYLIAAAVYISNDGNDNYNDGNDNYNDGNDNYNDGNDNYNDGNDNYNGGNDNYNGGNHNEVGIGPTIPSTSKTFGDLTIDEIARDLQGFEDKGWNGLYETGEFDCSRMTTYLWDYIRNKYKVAPKIVVAPERQHAWIALRVVDVGDTNRYEQWTVKGVSYYFVEATEPSVVTYEKNVCFGDECYSSTDEFYTVRIGMADSPIDANSEYSAWYMNEFRLTKADIDKLDSFKAK